MNKKEALRLVLGMAQKLYDENINEHILRNDLKITKPQQEALDYVEDYVLDLEQDELLKQMETLGLDSDFKKVED
jgi:hypothetical protein